jgi:hypothetical protein
MNGTGAGDLCDEFDRFVRGFGYFYEMGHAWNMGFYPLEDATGPTAYRTYGEKLLDPRWKEKRAEIVTRAGFACEECGLAGVCFEVHHCYYLRGWEPWEYPDYALKCLCRDCHELRAVAESRMNGFLASLTSDNLERVRRSLANDAFYWYPREAVIALIETLKYDHDKMDEAYSALKALRSHKHEREDADGS